MTYRLLRHPAVERDLRDIVELISDFAGPAVALDKLEQIQATLDRLRETPHIGSVRNDIYPNIRAIPSAKKAVIVFSVDDAQHVVKIIAICYAGADWLAKLATRS